MSNVSGWRLLEYRYSLVIPNSIICSVSSQQFDSRWPNSTLPLYLWTRYSCMRVIQWNLCEMCVCMGERCVCGVGAYMWCVHVFVCVHMVFVRCVCEMGGQGEEMF